MFDDKKNGWQDYVSNHRIISRPKSFWPPILAIVGVVIIILAIILFPLVTNGYEIYRHVKSLNNRAGLIINGSGLGSPTKLLADLAATRDDLTAIKYRSSQLGLILYVPQINKTSHSIDQMLTASIDLVGGYEEIIKIFSGLQNTNNEGEVVLNFSTAAGRKMILQSIVNNRDSVEKAKLKIQAARLVLSSINTNDLTGIFKTKVIFANQLLSEVISQSELALPLFKYLPELIGAGQTKNYLVLFQNNMELRPTGGFIGSYGVITLRDGEIINVFTDDIYNLDKLSEGKMFVPVPLPLSSYSSQKYLYLRDANWSPDWSTDAKEINQLWEKERANAGLPPLKLDGIVAITPDFIANFLSITGPITEGDVTFTEQNFALALEQAVEVDYAAKGIPLSARKNVIGDLTKELLSRLLALPPQDLMRLWSVIKKDTEEKQIIAWFADAELQNYIASENWSGEVKNREGDYFYVVDANVGALKTDAVMNRSVDYVLSPDGSGDLLGRLAITYQHTSKAVSNLVSAYRTYTRVYTPLGTQFTRVYLEDKKGEQDLVLNKDVALSSELNKQLAGVFFTIDPNKKKTLVLEYRLPENIKKMYQNGLYTLFVQKQPGTAGHKLRIDLKFDQLITAYHADILPTTFYGRNLVFDEDLKADREYSVKFQ